MPSFQLRKKDGRFYADIYDPERSPPRLTRTLRTTSRRTALQKAQMDNVED